MYIYVQTDEEFAKQIKVLKEVKAMLLGANINSVEKMNHINLLACLGVSYHFRNEIDVQLDVIFDTHANYDNQDYDLYKVALHLQVFRQYGLRYLVLSPSKPANKEFSNQIKEFLESVDITKYNESCDKPIWCERKVT